jgi:hypothetical protein
MATWTPITPAKPGDPISSEKFNLQGLGNLQYLYDTLAALSTRVGTNESAITALTSRVTANENALATLTPRVTTNENAIAALTPRVTANESAITSLQGRMTTAENALTALGSRVTAVEGKQPIVGSWTPTITADGGASGQTYAAQIGQYVKIDRYVCAIGYVGLSVKGTLTGNVMIGGFPFPFSTTLASGLFVSYWLLNTPKTWMSGDTVSGSTNCYLRSAPGGGATSLAPVVAADLVANSGFTVAVNYIV